MPVNRYFGKLSRYIKDGVMHYDVWHYDRTTGKLVVLQQGFDCHSEHLRIGAEVQKRFLDKGLWYSERVDVGRCLVKVGQEERWHVEYQRAIVEKARAAKAATLEAASGG